jgi:hypothetical protein
MPAVGSRVLQIEPRRRPWRGRTGQRGEPRPCSARRDLPPPLLPPLPPVLLMAPPCSRGEREAERSGSDLRRRPRPAAATSRRAGEVVAVSVFMSSLAVVWGRQRICRGHGPAPSRASPSQGPVACVDAHLCRAARERRRPPCWEGRRWLGRCRRRRVGWSREETAVGRLR